MKKTLQRLGIVTVGLSLCLWSCKEQDGILKPSEGNTSLSKEIFVKEGRLIFDSKESFWKQVDDLKTAQSIIAFDNKFKEFTSMKEKYDELLKHDIGVAIEDGSLKDYQYSYQITTNEDGSKEFDIAIRNKAIATLLNHKGIIQIGDSVYRLNDKEITQVQERSINELFVRNSGSVKITPIKKFAISNKANKSAKQMASSFDEIVNLQEYTPPGEGFSPRRFKTAVSMSLLWGKATGNYWTIHKRLNWYGWGGANTNEWNFNTNGYVYAFSTLYGYNNGFPTYSIPTGVNWREDNKNDLTHYFDFSISGLTNNDGQVYRCTMGTRMNWQARGHDGILYSYNSNSDYPNGINIDSQ